MSTNITAQQWVLDLFQRLTEEKTPEGHRNFVYAHPVLLSVQALQFLVAAGCDRDMLALLDRVRLHLWDHPENFAAELGPLHAPLEGLRSRQLSYADARTRAVQPECAGLLSNTYIKVLFEPLLDEVWKGGAFPPRAAELVLDSAWAMPFADLAVHVRLAATRGFILVVHAAVMKNPDGRLLERAHQAGDWALNSVDWSAIPGGRAEILHELGVMDLDAYTWQWPASADYGERISSWLARAVNPMPEPAAALARADRLLTEAVDLRAAGSERGATLKALLQARIFEGAASGSPPDTADLRTLAGRALEHLNPETDTEAVEWVRRAMHAFNLE